MTKWKLKPNKPIFFVYQQLAHDTQLSQVGNYDLDPDSISPDIFNSEESKRSDEDQSTIQFGEPMESKTFSKHFVVYFQLFCYFFFVGRRVSKMIFKQRLKFFTNLYKYMRKGQKEGVRPQRGRKSALPRDRQGRHVRQRRRARRVLARHGPCFS